MKRKESIYYDCPASPFRSHEVTVELKPGKLGPELTIYSAGVAAVRSLPVRILSANDATSALSAKGAPPILHFPNNTRHPAGREAAVSWYNDRGEGWIRLIQPNRLVALLDLQGWVVPEAAKAIPSRGKRGPPKSMDLWVAIAALLSPTLFDGAYLEAATGINRFNVYDWLKRATAAGLITALRGGRRSCFQITPEQSITVAEFIRSSWKEWRIGQSIARLRPDLAYFIANHEWPSFIQQTQVRPIPVGVTWLEGHGGGQLFLSPEGNIPRLTFLCKAGEWKRLANDTLIVPRPEQKRPYDSVAIILHDDHPLWRIAESRINRHATYAWPPGLCVLEGMVDPFPRIRDVAEKAWYQWVEQTRDRFAEMRLPPSDSTLVLP